MANKQNKRKRNLKSKPNTIARQFWSKAGALVIAGSIALGVISKLPSREDKVTIARTVELDGDDFDGIPVRNNVGDEIGVVDSDSLVVVRELDDDAIDGEVAIVAVGENYSILEGFVDEDYIVPVQSIATTEFEDYNTVYEIPGESGAFVRSSAEIAEDDNRIASVGQGMQVLGNKGDAVPDGSNEWIPVLYVDEDGELQDGYMRSDVIQEKRTIKEEKIDALVERSKAERDFRMVVDTTVDGGINLNLRAETSTNSEVVAVIPNGSVITSLSNETVDDGSRKWRNVEYVDSNGKTRTGWVSNSYLREYESVMMKVNAKEDGKNKLRVYEDASRESDVVGKIKNKKEIEVLQFDIDHRVNDGDTTWIRVVLSDGTVGYVNYDSLEEVRDEKEVLGDSETIEEIMDGITLSPGGYVTGIDVSNASAEDLRRVIQEGEIGETQGVAYTERQIPSGDLAGEIGFVYIKLGATGYGSHFSPNVREDALEKAKVLEELGVPYGFYYYSASVTEEEAREEARVITDALQGEISELKYNKLPFAMDCEVHMGGDRQMGVDVTEYRAITTNAIEPVVGKTILYTNPRVTNPGNSEYVLDIDRYSELLDSGETWVWVAGYRNADGSFPKNVVQFMNDRGDQVVIHQAIGDSSIGGVTLDVNYTTEEKFRKMMEYKNRVEQVLSSEEHSDYVVVNSDEIGTEGIVTDTIGAETAGEVSEKAIDDDEMEI